MDGEAVKRIEELAINASCKEKDGITYVTENYHPLGVVHECALKFSTLRSLCDYIMGNPQNQDFEGSAIVVNSDFTVSFLSKPNKLDGQRTVFAVAKRHDVDGFAFGRQYSTEDFIIALKSKFVRADSEWNDVFNIVKKIQIDDTVNINDDGLSQKVTLKQGVSAASIKTVDVKTDFELKPYRIFSECDQPKSIFFLRLSGSRESGVFVSLYETDGGGWKNDAALSIKTFIETELSNSDKLAEIPVYC